MKSVSTFENTVSVRQQKKKNFVQFWVILPKIVLVGSHFDFLGICFHLVSTHVI